MGWSVPLFRVRSAPCLAPDSMQRSWQCQCQCGASCEFPLYSKVTVPSPQDCRQGQRWKRSSHMARYPGPGVGPPLRHCSTSLPQAVAVNKLSMIARPHSREVMEKFRRWRVDGSTAVAAGGSKKLRNHRTDLSQRCRCDVISRSRRGVMDLQ